MLLQPRMTFFLLQKTKGDILNNIGLYFPFNGK